MPNILILGSPSSSETSPQYYEDYQKFFMRAGQQSQQRVIVKYALFDDLLFEIGPGVRSIQDTRNKCRLEDYDVVFIRGHFRTRLDVAFVASRYLASHQRKVI